jgi:hypothetical protein
MYYINLVHSRINIFDSNHWRPQDILELHDKLKDKTQLISDALCRASKWKEKKMANIARFKLPFQPCAWQGHENDDTFFAWKNIEYWNRDAWTRQIKEVTNETYVRIIVFTSIFTSHIRCNSAANLVVFYAEQRNTLPGRDSAVPHVPPDEKTKDLPQ